MMKGPGYLFRAPIGTAEPTHTVSGSKFTDTWPGAWASCGATAEGSTFSYQITAEGIYVAEFFDPISWETTARSGSLSFAMADYTLTHWSYALNSSGPTIVSGTGATQLNKLNAPAPGNEVRCMLGWESLDSTMRIIIRQALSAAEVASQFAKAPAFATIPVQFNFEVPAAAQPFDLLTAGAGRA
jgi:hypothetical protein